MLLLDPLLISNILYFCAFPSFFVCVGKRQKNMEKMMKNINLTIKRHAKHLFTGQNTQQIKFEKHIIICWNNTTFTRENKSNYWVYVLKAWCIRYLWMHSAVAKRKSNFQMQRIKWSTELQLNNREVARFTI